MDNDFLVGTSYHGYCCAGEMLDEANQIFLKRRCSLDILKKPYAQGKIGQEGYE